MQGFIYIEGRKPNKNAEYLYRRSDLSSLLQKMPDHITILYPTPFTVVMQSIPSFWRIFLMCTSMVLSPTITSVPHIWLNISLRRNTLPGLVASRCSSSNSFLAKTSYWSFTRTINLTGSIVILPACKILSFSGFCTLLNSVFTLVTSILGLTGLLM